MRFPRPRKNLQQLDAGSLGGPLPMVGGQPVPIVSTQKHLGPDVTAGSERIEETPEAKAKRLAAEAATLDVGKASEMAKLGVAPEVAAAAPAPTVVAPIAPPAGHGLTGGIPQMPTIPTQQDANKQALDALAKQQADEKAAKEAWLNGEAQKRSDQALANIAKAEAEYKTASKRLTEKQDNGWLHNALSALAVGFGAYGAAKTGSPNFALQIVENATRQDFERRKAELDSKYEEYKMAGARLKDIDPWKDREIGRLTAMQKSRLDQLQKAADVSLSRFPQAKLQTDAAIAAEKEKIAQTQLGYVKEVGQIHRKYSETKQADTVSETTPKTDANVRAPVVSGESAKKAMFASKILDSVKYIRDENAKGVDLTDDDLRRLQNNINEIRSQAENAVKGLDKPMWISAMKKAGLTAEKLTEGIPDERAPIALAYLEGSGAVIRDDSGAAITNYEDLGTAMKKMPQPGEGKKTRGYKLDNLEREGQQRMRASGPEAVKLLTGKYPEGYEYLEKNRPSVVPAPAAKATNATIIKIRDQYKEAAAVKPGSPDYDEAQSFMKAAEAKYGRAVR